MIPWFIWKEIITYVIPHDRQLCLVNREWFEFSIGQVFTLDSDKLKLDYQQPSWFKLANRIVMNKLTTINWEFLKEFRQLIWGEFKLSVNSDKILSQLKEFISNSNIRGLRFNFNSDKELERGVQLLQGFSQYLKKLELDKIDLKVVYDNLLKLDYTNLKELVLHLKTELIPFNLINETMPNIERIYIHITWKEIPYATTDNFIFSNLKILEIHGDIYPKKDYTKTIINIFSCSFPKLNSLLVRGIRHDPALELITRNMPQLKKLDLDLHHMGDTELFFPLGYLNQLQELKVTNFSYLQSKCVIGMDLALMPKLYKLHTTDQFHLFNSNEFHQPLINNLKFNHLKDSKIQIDQFQFLNTLKFNCRNKNFEFTDIFQFCTKIQHLSLLNIQDCINPQYFITGPSFKTHSLELIGIRMANYLTNDLISWLSNQFQLKKLRVEYNGRKNISLKPQVFSKSLDLIVKAPHPETELKIKSAFVDQLLSGKVVKRPKLN